MRKINRKNWFSKSGAQNSWETNLIEQFEDSEIWPANLLLGKCLISDPNALTQKEQQRQSTLGHIKHDSNHEKSLTDLYVIDYHTEQAMLSLYQYTEPAAVHRVTIHYTRTHARRARTHTHARARVRTRTHTRLTALCPGLPGEPVPEM